MSASRFHSVLLPSRLEAENRLRLSPVLPFRAGQAPVRKSLLHTAGCLHRMQHEICHVAGFRNGLRAPCSTLFRDNQGFCRTQQRATALHDVWRPAMSRRGRIRGGGSGEFCEGQEQGRLGQEGQAGNFPCRACQTFLLGRFEGHHEGQVVFLASRLLQNGVDVDAMPSQNGADAPQDAGPVADHEAQVGSDHVLIWRRDSGRAPALVAEGSGAHTAGGD